MRRVLILVSVLLALVVTLAACGGGVSDQEFDAVQQDLNTEKAKVSDLESRLAIAEATPEPQAPRTLTVLVGAGQDTTVIVGFFPSTLRIRAGDTVVWKLNSDESLQVMFTSGEVRPDSIIPVPDVSGLAMLNPQDFFPSRLPGAPVETYSGTGFLNSGVMSKEAEGPPGTPPNDTFNLTFDTPGTYVYTGAGDGKVIVEPSNALDVPSQSEIDAQAQEELAPLKTFIEEVQAGISLGYYADQEPRPDGTDTWLVRAGLGTAAYGHFGQEAQLLEFSVKDLTIKQGDLVVWTSNNIHTVTFNQAPPPPEFVVPVGGEQGRPLLLVNPQVMLPVVPSPEFDPSQYYNSGLISPGRLGGGAGFSLTFNQTGTFEYVCLIHRELGMKGSITVTAR